MMLQGKHIVKCIREKNPTAISFICLVPSFFTKSHINAQIGLRPTPQQVNMLVTCFWSTTRGTPCESSGNAQAFLLLILWLQILSIFAFAINIWTLSHDWGSCRHHLNPCSHDAMRSGLWYQVPCSVTSVVSGSEISCLKECAYTLARSYQLSHWCCHQIIPRKYAIWLYNL